MGALLGQITLVQMFNSSSAYSHYGQHRAMRVVRPFDQISQSY